MTRVAIYARYSSDNQRDASIEDQVRLCRERAEKEGWSIAEIYTDHAVSGASMMRPGIQMLMLDGAAGKFDRVLSEALDRLSRDQEDIAGVYKRLHFSGVSMFTLSEGEISELHIGLKGTMNALFLKDLADKTRRGLRGRVEKGKSGGGITYGYDVVKAIVNGEPVTGERKINKDQTKIVLRIFDQYLKGKSPRAIAAQLNKDKILGPQGREWGASTIYGNRRRGTGILNNELYIGKLVWNRLRYMKAPNTGKRVSRLNPQEEWITKDVPDLRIIEQDVWDKVKTKQGAINKAGSALWKKNRPRNLFSHLIKCGCCGGGFAMTSKTLLSCSTARNKGTCDNQLRMRRDELEQAVLGALQTHLMDDQLCKHFCDEYTKHVNRVRMDHNASLVGYQSKLTKLAQKEERIIQAIMDGYATDSMKQSLKGLEAQQLDMKRILESMEEAPVLFHPKMADRYHKEVRDLIGTLNDDEHRSEATEILRTLIDKIVLTPSPEGDRLVVDLYGDLAGILSVAAQRDKLRLESDLFVFNQKREALDQESPNGSNATDDQNSDSEIKVQFVEDQADSQSSSVDEDILALVAGVRSNRQFSSENEGVLAMVAGVGFEPTTFRL